MSRSSRRLQKKTGEEGAVGGLSSETSEDQPDSQARHASLQEEDRSESKPTPDYMHLFSRLSAQLASSTSEPQPEPSSAEDEEFSLPKRTAKATARTTPTPVDLRNSFEALTDNEEEQEPTPALLQPTYRDKMPPIFLKLTPSQEYLDEIKSLIHASTRIQIQGPYLKILTKDKTEYARLLKKSREEQWEYFTYNPMINDRTKFALKGLPTTTDCATIQTAFNELNIHVNYIKQMTARQNPIPVWVLTTDKTTETRNKLINLTGLLHFRVRIENLKRRQTVTQCLRCQGFGHKATFCRLQRKCRLCAQLHDSRECPNRESTPKCAGCGGEHFASSPDCPKRKKYSEILKPKPATSVTHPNDYPPLQTPNQNPQPLPPPPRARQPTPNQNSTHQSSSLLEIFSLLANPAIADILSQLAIFLSRLIQSPSALSTIRTFLSSANTFLN